MEPRIQYAKTSDGVNIAYAMFGSGPAIVFVGSLWGDIQMYAAGPPSTLRMDTLVKRGRRIIRYDNRGAGSSDRTVADMSLNGRVRDIEAVADAAGLEAFALVGSLTGGPPAISYAARHPDRVSRLVLVNTYARGEEYFQVVPAFRQSQATIAMAEDQWEYYTLSLANAVTGFSDPERARLIATGLRSSMSPQVAVVAHALAKETDVTDLLNELTAPTLIIHDRSSPIGDFAPLMRGLASRIPGARFVATEDASAAVDEFLSEGEAVPASADLPSGTAVILFADIADSTALTERLGDAAFRAKARELDGALRSAIRERSGTPIEGKLLGDGVLAVFTSARQAIEAALACGRAGDEGGLPLHLGLHAGDVIREENNVYGGAVNIASRIAGLSAAGEVLVSETVRSLARTSAGVGFEDRGEQALKGVGEAVRVWAVVAGSV